MIIATAASVMIDAMSRVDKAGQALLGAMSMGGEGAPEAVGAMIAAKTEFSAGAVIARISDNMMRELLNTTANDP